MEVKIWNDVVGNEEYFWGRIVGVFDVVNWFIWIVDGRLNMYFLVNVFGKFWKNSSFL